METSAANFVDIYNGSNQVLSSDSLLPGIVDPLANNDIVLNGSSSLFQTCEGEQFDSPGNIVIGNGQWIIGSENTPENFTSAVTATVDGLVYSIFDKLRNRLPLSDAGNESSGGNPFADGSNPFGEGNMPSLPAYNQNIPIGIVNPVESGENPVESGENLVESGENPVESGENLVEGGENPVEGGENPVEGGENPFAGGENPVEGGENSVEGGENPFAGGGIPQQSSFDISQFVFGDSLEFLNSTDISSGDSSVPPLSTIDILSSVQANLLGFTSSIDKMFASGNTTPLETPSDLLRLFRADMFSFNSGIEAVNQLAASDSSTGGSNPFGNLFTGDGQIPSDIVNILKVALDGLLPFNGSDNVFTTSEGEIPIGYGNRDFGNGNAVIGNANWDYGNYNASIGNGNWHWDSSSDNASIGNGNWHLDFSSDNRTVGNGNWYWDSTRDNTTLGNGNWHFGNNNTTLGNGNWDFGSNNTVIGNGNWVFTSNSIVIGNGNWSVIIDKSTTGAENILSNLETLTLGMGVKDAVDSLANSFIGRMGEAFLPLTGDLGDSARQTYDQLILSDDIKFV